MFKSIKYLMEYIYYSENIIDFFENKLDKSVIVKL